MCGARCGSEKMESSQFGFYWQGQKLTGAPGEKIPLKVQKMPVKLKMKGENMSPDSNGCPLLYFTPFTLYSLCCQILTCECASWVVCSDL